jgi:hypothetical protein
LTTIPETPPALRGEARLREEVATEAEHRRRFRLRSVHGLGVLVVASATAHVIASLARATVVFFPDEYLYSELSRSVSSSGLPLVRGSLVSFPSLLQPILTAPCWLLGSVAASFHAAMVVGSLAMSLAALPVYWLGRRLGLSGWLALACSAFTLAVPSMLYSSWLMGESFAYPLFLAGFAMGVLALAGERRRLVPALVLFVLAALARIQLLILPIAFAGAAVLMAACEHRLRRFIRERRYLIGGAVAIVVAVPVIPQGALGFYGGGIHNVDLAPGAFASHLWQQVIGLIFACLWIILPGALIGLGLGLVRFRSRLELAFACGTLAVVVALLVQTALFGAVFIPQERYLFYGIPALALSLALLADRGWPLRRLHALLVLPLLGLAALMPVSTFASGDRLHQSSFLIASYRLEQSLGVANASLLVAVVVSALALATLTFPFSRRLGTVGILGLATGAAAITLGLSTDFDSANSARIAHAQAPGKSWIDKRIDADDRSGGRAVLLQGYDEQDSSVTQLFWNRSVDRVALLPGSKRPDVLAWPRLRIGLDGSLSVGGKALDGPVVIDNFMHTIELRGAIEAARSTTFSLWLPRGRPRFSLYASGFASGKVASIAAVEVWPEQANRRLAGFLSFRLCTEPRVGAVKFSLRLPGAASKEIWLPKGESRAVRVAVCSNRPWRATMRADRGRIEAGRFTSARSTVPAWQPDASACAVAPSERVSG